MKWQWKKRECPIKIKVVPEYLGWTEVTIEISGDHHYCDISECCGDGFWALVSCLCCLHPLWYANYEIFTSKDVGENWVYVDELDDGSYLYCHRVNEGDASDGESSLKKFHVEWDFEEIGVKWTISRPINPGLDFDITIKLEKWRDIFDGKRTTEETFSYSVRYSDFCYALGKGITDAVKSISFIGFKRSSSDVNIPELCFIKALGMRCPHFHRFIAIAGGPAGLPKMTTFAEEMELLNFDM